MAETWMPGIHHDRGALANYERGRNREQAVKLHYTVGVNSAPIGKQGYFQFLVPRSGTPIQFAPADAVNWDSGDWNDAGPGIEFEYYEPKDGPHPANIVTDSQIEWGGKIIRWLSEQRGYPLDFYDGPRISESSGFRGFITHRSLVQSEQHYDYITTEQFARMTEGAPTPAPPPPIPNPEEDAMSVVFNQGNLHDFAINDNGACVEVYATSPTTWKSRKVFPDGSCVYGDEPRVCKPVPSADVYFVTAVASVGGGRKRNSARWNGSAYDQVALEVPA